MKHIQLFFLLTTFAFVASAQNVGIGTPIPSDQLHTTGTVRFEKYRGANTRMMQIDSSGRLVVTAAGAVSSNPTAYAISDNGCAAGIGVTSTILVSGQASAVPSSKIAVRINITHTLDADLRIYLYPPTGLGVLVLAAGNGSSGDNFTNTLFTDQAPVSITTGTAPFTGQYRPKGGALECFASGTPLATFAGFGNIVPNGTWTLRVLDNGVSGIGILNSWSISFSGPESISTADENNYLPKFSAGNLVASSVSQPAGSINIGIGIINPVASLQVARGTGPGGTAQFNGTQNSSSFNSGVTENTVIRGGKTGSEVIINDIGTGNVRIADAGGNVGIGIGIPTAKLHVNGAMKITNGSQGLGKVLTSDAAGLATWATLTGTGWSASGADIYNSNAGNVGVGTNAPAYILDVNSRMRIRHNGINTAGIWLNKSDNTEGSFIGNVNDTIVGFWGPAGAGSYKAVIDVKNGAVGIGVLDPKVPLSFESSTGNKISLFGTNTTNVYGLGVQGGLLQVFSDYASSDIGFGYGSSTAFTERMRIKGNGNVGIGINNPTASLDVVRGTGTDGTARFLGTQYASHFNYSIGETTYIRGGKADSKVIINDYSTGDVLISPTTGKVGIGVSMATNKLTVSDNTVNAAAYISQSGTGYAIQVLSGEGTAINAISYNTNAPAMTVNGGSASIVTDGSIGVGTTSPAFILDVNGRMRIRNNGSTAGLWFNNTTNLNNQGSFAGLRNDQQFGVFGNGSWKFAINNADGTMYVGSPNLDGENPALGAGYKLRVYGKIISEEVKVQLKTAWPDYVFSKNYRLRSLRETEKFIAEHGHLPNMPAAADVEKTGLVLGDMQTRMMEKIEELTLYVIDLKKEIEALKMSKK